MQIFQAHQEGSASGVILDAAFSSQQKIPFVCTRESWMRRYCVPTHRNPGWQTTPARRMPRLSAVRCVCNTKHRLDGLQTRRRRRHERSQHTAQQLRKCVLIPAPEHKDKANLMGTHSHAACTKSTVSAQGSAANVFECRKLHALCRSGT
jgi:hypothetical protein